MLNPKARLHHYKGMLPKYPRFFFIFRDVQFYIRTMKVLASTAPQHKANSPPVPKSSSCRCFMGVTCHCWHTSVTAVTGHCCQSPVSHLSTCHCCHLSATVITCQCCQSPVTAVTCHCNHLSLLSPTCHSIHHISLFLNIYTKDHFQNKTLYWCYIDLTIMFTVLCA